MKGWVYIISNKAMPDIIKIGFSTKDPELRASELNNTGAPHPYFVEYDALVEEPYRAEQRIHESLSEHREGKEWFKCSINTAIEAIRSILNNDIIIENCRQSIDSDQPINISEFKSIGCISCKCPHCSHRYKVTLTRYESSSVCPNCSKSHSVNVGWL